MRIAWLLTMDVHRNYGECQRTEREELVFIANDSIEDLGKQMDGFISSPQIMRVTVKSVVRVGEVY